MCVGHRKTEPPRFALGISRPLPDAYIATSHVFDRKEQQAFRLRKLRTCFAAQDLDNDGYLTTEDFKLMAKRFIEYGKLDKERKGDHQGILGYLPRLRPE